MFFFWSKILDVLLSPIVWVLLALGEALRRQRTASAAVPLGVACVMLYGLSLEPVADRLWGALERGAVTTFQKDQTYDAVVVLGGLAGNGPPESPYDVAYNDNVELLLVAYDLLRAGSARYVILSSGPIVPLGRIKTEADLLALQLRRWGIDADRIVVESQSRNTHENAVESARIVRERGWTNLLLVTSAFHLPRAVGCFRAVGLDVATLPVDYRVTDSPAWSFLPRAMALERSSAAVREAMGRLIYRWRGYSR